MDHTSVLSPRANRHRKKKKKSNDKNWVDNSFVNNNNKMKSKPKPKSKLKKSKSKSKLKRSKSKSKFSLKQNENHLNNCDINASTQYLQQMFMTDNDYWKQYYEEVLSPANRYPLPPQAPPKGISPDIIHSSADSQKDLLASLNANNNINNKSDATSINNNDNNISDLIHNSPERIPELSHRFYLYEYALLNDLKWNKGKNINNIEKSFKDQYNKKINNIKPNNLATHYHNHMMNVTNGAIISSPSPIPPSYTTTTTTTSTTTTTTTTTTHRHHPYISNRNPIKEFPSQKYDVSNISRRKYSQDPIYYTSYNWKSDNNNNNKQMRNNNDLSETIKLINNSDIKWFSEGQNDDKKEEKRFDFLTSDDDNDNDLASLTQSKSLNIRNRNKKHKNIRKIRIKKYKTIGNINLDNFYLIDNNNNNSTTDDDDGSFVRASTARLDMMINNNRNNNNNDAHIEFDKHGKMINPLNEEFNFDEFKHHNHSLDIRYSNSLNILTTKTTILGSDFLTFELNKECISLELLINKIRSENDLLHEIINNLNIDDITMLEMILIQLSEYSLSLSNQLLCIDIACDVLREITEIPILSSKNDARAQCVEYQSSIIDISKIASYDQSSNNQFNIWRDTVWNKNDFISQEKYDINVMKHNRINENRPRNLYINLNKKILTIHDPTKKGMKKDNKILTSELIKSFNYTVNENNVNDVITISYYQQKIGHNKKHFNALVQKYNGHRFVALMKTFVSPNKIPSSFKFGSGPFTVERMFPNANRFMDFELPDNFPIKFMLNLLQQKYVSLALMEKWCWSSTDSSSWMTDSLITSISSLKPQRKQQIEKLINSFNLFLKFQGYELVSMLPISNNNKSKLVNINNYQPKTRYSYSKNNNIQTNWLDSKLDQLSIPKLLCSLIPSLAEYLHDCCYNDLKNEGWNYSINHSFTNKLSPWLLSSWNKLPPSAKNIRTQQAVILIKGVIAAGMFIKPIDLTSNRRKK